MIKLKYNFKQWHIFTISEFFKNVNVVKERISEVYYNILESNINENGRGKMLQNIAIDNIISTMPFEEVCSIKKAVSYSKQDENVILHIADIIIKYEERFYEDVLNYYHDLYTILKKLLANNYSSSVEKNKIILYLCEVCNKWLTRIIKSRSLPDSTTLERRIEVEYERPFVKLLEIANICLQKELRVITSNINSITPDIMLKYLILFRDFHVINPLFSVENKIEIDSNFTDKDSKEKKLFTLNILYIIFNATISPECDARSSMVSESKKQRLVLIMESLYKDICHPYIYSMIAKAIPKLAAWAKQNPENKEWFCKLVDKWVMDNIFEVNRTIEEKAQQLGDSIFYKICPHRAARILHSLAKDHSDLIDKELVIKVMWVYRKLLLFLENFFKQVAAPTGVPVNTKIELREKYKEIFFPTDMEIKYEISDLHYSQVSIVYSMKVAAVKMHEFDINNLDDYLKLLDQTISYCKNDDLSMLIYEIYECLLQSPKPNVLGVKIDLSLAKKVWLGGCLLKKAVGESSKKLKDKMETIITDVLTSYKLNSLDELMGLYEYAVFFFTNQENKKKIQRAFEASFGSGLFTRLRLIFENKDDAEFTKMNFPPIIMRKISEAIMSHFDDRLIICRSAKCLMLRDLSNSDGTQDNNSGDVDMVGEDDAEVDKIITQHKKFLEDPKMRDEKQIFDMLKNITNIHEAKYYYTNVKKLFPQVWKSFSKEQKNYLSQ